MRKIAQQLTRIKRVVIRTTQLNRELCICKNHHQRAQHDYLIAVKLPETLHLTPYRPMSMVRGVLHALSAKDCIPCQGVNVL